ncbi:MAG: xanthine dehydrogenase family protein molybdopterin-binding subunit [Candidatus Latescibacterota bacterium]
MAEWKPTGELQVMGGSLPRVDAPLKVSGQARYTHDVQLAGMLYGAALSCPHASAVVGRVDGARASALPGVRAVLTDLLGDNTVHHAGELVAAVAAVSPEVARDALELIDVEYQPRDFAVDLDEAMEPASPRVFADRDNVQEPATSGEGDVEAAFAAAQVVVEDEFRTQVQVHSPLETHVCVASWEGDELTLWTSTQSVHGVRRGVAEHMGVPLNKVRVICHHMGGGFGSKLWPGPEVGVAIRLARQAGAPVRFALTRRQEHLLAGNRPNSIQQLRLGARRDGSLVAFSARTWGTSGISPDGAGMPHPYVYRVPTWRHEHRDVVTNAGAGRPFRAPGHPQACFAMEQLMDELAEKLGMDPLELRLRNDPHETRRQEWRIGAERFGWQARSPRPGSDPGSIKRGMGLAASTWPTGGGGTQVEVRVYGDGGVEVRCGTQDLGTGTWTLVAAVAAESLGLPLAAVRPLIGDSDYPYSGSSGGSTTAPSVAPAVHDAAQKARAQLAALAARQLQAEPEDLVFAGERVAVAGRPDRGLSWQEVCGLLEAEPLIVQGQWVEGLSSAGVAGCQFAQVAVDTLTGRIEVERVLAVADCGLVVNRLTTQSQIGGAIVQGVSYALLEERLMDRRTGTVVNADLENYRIAGALEVPQIEVILFDQPERGVVGIGEPPTIPTAAAVANAVAHALGVRLRQLPMTPERVLGALEGAS